MLMSNLYCKKLHKKKNLRKNRKDYQSNLASKAAKDFLQNLILLYLKSLLILQTKKKKLKMRKKTN
jgi:hypothetical protein